jgi:hypothetical protein
MLEASQTRARECRSRSRVAKLAFCYEAPSGETHLDSERGRKGTEQTLVLVKSRFEPGKEVYVLLVRGTSLVFMRHPVSKIGTASKTVTTERNALGISQARTE